MKPLKLLGALAILSCAARPGFGAATPRPGVYVSSRDSQQVLRYDATSGVLLDVFASGSGMSGPEALTFGPDGNLYVADRPSNSILRFDGQSGGFLDAFVPNRSGDLIGPRDLTFGPDGHLYVSSYDSNRILVYDGTTGAFRGIFASVAGPRGITFRGGDVYVASDVQNQILHYRLSGSYVGIFASDPQIQGPREITFGPDGNLYVSSSTNNVVLRFDGTTGDFLGIFTTGTSGLVFPRGLAFGPDGNLYVVSANANDVLVYNGTSGSFIAVFASTGGLNFPTGVAFPPAAPTPRTISHVANGSGFRTSIILVNTGFQAANFDLKLWDETGNPLVLDFGTDGVTAELTGAIQPGVSRFIQTTGTNPSLQKGWAELTAPNIIDGNSIFGLQSPGQGDSEAAVPLSPAGGTRLFVPFSNNPPFVTGMAFANPGQQSANVTGSFVRDTGQPISDIHTVHVAARGHNSDVLGNFFPNTQLKNGAAQFNSNTSLFGLGIRSNGKAFTSIEALSGVTTATKTIAHIASGGGWSTAFLLVNTGTQAANFTLKFWDDAGLALPLLLGADGNAISVTGTIQPGALRTVQTQSVGNLATGWAELAVTGPIGGTAIFALQTQGPPSEAAVPFSTSGSTQLYMPYDYTTGYSTGMAFTNPSLTTPATITLSFVDDSGNTLATGINVPVPAHGHKSVVLSDLFGGIVGTRGTVLVTSTVPIRALGIRANGVAFTSLKVITQ